MESKPPVDHRYRRPVGANVDGVKRLVVFAVVGLAIAIFTSLPLAAQAPNSSVIEVPPAAGSLSATPSILDLGVRPAVPTTTSVRITNTSGRPVTLRASAEPFEPPQSVKADDSDRYDASGWFSFDAPEFTLRPGEAKDVSIAVLPPGGATPGGHYATLVFEPVPVEPALAGQSSVNIAGRIGVLALLTVAGQAQQDLVVEDQLNARGLYFAEAPSFGFSVRNNGNVHTLVSGQLTLHRYRGDDITFDISPELVLPLSQRRIDIQLDDAVSPGLYSASATLTYGAPIEQLTTESSPFLTAPPWLLLSGLALLAIAIAVCVHWLRRKREPRR